MNNLKISILLISYNNFKYIFEALDSIFKQDYDNIQLIISDDGSKDFNEKELLQYINKIPHNNVNEILVNINKENLGTVKHLEKLYELCTGTLVTVIAADDAYANETAISSLVNEYKAYNGKYRAITSLLAICGTELSEIKSVFTKEDDVELINSGDTRKLLDELAYRCIMPSSGTIAELSVYKEIGKLSNDYVYVEDWSSHIRMLRLGIKIRCLNQITVLHRDGGISHGNERAHNNAYLQYYSDLLTIYEVEIEPYKEVFSLFGFNRATNYYRGRLNRYNADKLKFLDPSKKKIVFFFRKNVVAQGDYALYYRIASFIAKNYDYVVCCINNGNRAMLQKYSNTKICFCDITKDNIHQFEDATFVTAYNQAFFLLDEIRKIKKAKILLLFLHPMITDWMNGQVFSKMFNQVKVLTMLKHNNAYAFMDEANREIVEGILGEHVEERFFPVVINRREFAEEIKPIPLLNNNEVNIAWLGRLDNDKVYSLMNFIDNIKDLNFDGIVNIHLIGDGNGVAFLLSQLHEYAPKIRLFFNSYMYGNERDQYLIDNADLVIAMGVSALDVATLNIPIIIPIVSSEKFYEDMFIYLYDTKNYCLGWSANNLKSSGCKWHTAADVLNDIYNDKRKEEIGMKCKEYALNIFAVENNVQKIVDIINGTTLTKRKFTSNFGIFFQYYMFLFFKKLYGLQSYEEFLQFRIKIKQFIHAPLKYKFTKVKNGIKRLFMVIFHRSIK